MRTIKIKDSANSGLIAKQTEARTLAQLKEAFREINFNNKRVMVQQTRTTLEVDDSVIPDGDVTIFLFPVSTKAGMTEQEIDNLSYLDLRRAAAAVGVPGSGTKEEMRSGLKKHYEGKSSGSETVRQVSEPFTTAEAQPSTVAALAVGQQIQVEPSGPSLVQIIRHIDGIFGRYKNPMINFEPIQNEVIEYISGLPVAQPTRVVEKVVEKPVEKIVEKIVEKSVPAQPTEEDCLRMENTRLTEEYNRLSRLVR